jgi:hypothetical protein
MSTPGIAPPKVQVFATVGQAFRFVWAERNDFMTFALVPIVVLAIIATAVSGAIPDDPSALGALGALGARGSAGFALFAIVNLVALTYFGVAWHRRYLVPQERATARDALRWHPRHWRFLWITIVLSIGSGFAIILGSMSTLALSPGGGALGTLAVLIGVALAAARLLVLLPAATIDDFMTFRAGWALGRGNSWRLLNLLLLATLPVLVADGGIRALLFLVFGDAPGLLGRFVEAFVFEVAGFAGAAIGISALSSAYLQLLQGRRQMPPNLPAAMGAEEEDRDET